MKKYFMCSSGKEIKFGDRIELDLTEDLKDGSVNHKHLECKFHPILVDLLIEQGVIEKKEVKREEEETEESFFLDEIFERLSALEDRITELEGQMAELYDDEDE